MPKQGQAMKVRQNTPSERTAKKDRVIELRAEGHSWSAAAREADVSLRTIQDWRQKDEKFAVLCAAVENNYRDFYVGKAREMALDPSTPAPQRAWLLMFIIKQADPSFRDNHKVEHIVSGGLEASLKALAKMGRTG